MKLTKEEIIKNYVHKEFNESDNRAYFNASACARHFKDGLNYFFQKTNKLNNEFVFKVDGELKLINKHGQPDCIRDDRGILVSFPKVTKWQGQEERYIQEINESFYLANIIINAIKKNK